ncbi:MAG: hypothetical protein AB7I96_13000 [Candidatus Dadabacteria bacterium]
MKKAHVKAPKTVDLTTKIVAHVFGRPHPDAFCTVTMYGTSVKDCIKRLQADAEGVGHEIKDVNGQSDDELFLDGPRFGRAFVPNSTETVLS